MLGMLSFIIVFGVLVTVHEFGHLYFAKRAGIMCPEFAIGMGPKLFSYKKDETLYTIRLLPVGGYVMMAGSGMEQNPVTAGMTVSIKKNEQNEVTHIILDDQHQFRQIEQLEAVDSDFEDQLFIKGIDQYTNEEVTYPIADEAYFVREGDLIQIAPRDRQFKNKKPWPKFLTLFAGPLFNFLLALVLFIGYFYVTGTPTDKAVIGDILQDSPADKAGLVTKDRVVSIDGNSISKWEDMTSYFNSNDIKTHHIIIERDGRELKKEIKPVKATLQDGSKQVKRAVIGVNPLFTHDNLLDPLIYGVKTTFKTGLMIFSLVGALFTSIFTGTFSFDMLNGPVGIYKNTEKIASLGILPLVYFTASLSVNLGIMNLLPIPALDGGRILFVLYEAIFRRPVNKKAEIAIISLGAVFLFFVMIMVTWNDIQRYFF
ncbi:RIP metalloprotease RseP [Macrococcus equipercicus]|uniref:Zinc metalloprotease n=1 Tax=Macrococcus equipercicus TaxID=69967 RepID=A0A9Q9BX31_9STAP|nr:RIP metalloprotease RseP [Macrococcus equipercicus]UTH14678.1 RIP metalloprotease RseP [Macrococcus equipercicus]